MENINNQTSQQGWTLRDEIAMRAIQTLLLQTDCKRINGESENSLLEAQVLASYKVADTMLKHREL